MSDILFKKDDKKNNGLLKQIIEYLPILIGLASSLALLAIYANPIPNAETWVVILLFAACFMLSSTLIITTSFELRIMQNEREIAQKEVKASIKIAESRVKEIEDLINK